MIHLTGEGHELIVCRILREKWLQSQILMGFFGSSTGCPIAAGIPERVQAPKTPLSHFALPVWIHSCLQSCLSSTALGQNISSCCNTAQFEPIIPGKSTIWGCVQVSGREFQPWSVLEIKPSRAHEDDQKRRGKKISVTQFLAFFGLFSSIFAWF